MKTYRLDLVKGYSRLDHYAEKLIIREKDKFFSLRKIRRRLREMNLKIGHSMGKNDFLPRIDIVDSDGKRYKWGEL